MKPVLRIAAISALGALALAGCGGGSSRTPAAAATSPVAAIDTHSVTTRGTGMVSGVPDTLTVTLGVQTQSSTAKGALDANSQKANALIQALKSKGVAAKDLQTSELSIQPTYTQNGMQITGYHVTNMVKATLHSLTGAGALIDAAAGAAGDAVRVQQLSFSIGDDTALRSQARAQAVRQAQAQADQMTKAAGAKLGKIRAITEVPVSGPTPVYALGDAKAAAMPIQPGTQELSVLVDITYDIDQ
jgi:uncharacterized protein YggE